MTFSLFPIVISSLLTWTSAARSAEASTSDLEVILVRPNVENVIDVQQITITFNKPMVPLGDYEKLATGFAIQVTPQVQCQWRWLNGSTLACQLNQALPPSNSYSITVPSGIKALDGSLLKSSKTEKFTTLHWEVVNQEVEWKSPDLPLIYLSFNQSMNVSSLQSNVRSDCGSVRVSALQNQQALDLGVEATRTYLFSFDKPIGIDRSCQLELKGRARGAMGAVPSKDFSTTFKTFPDFKIARITCSPMIEGKEADKKTFKIESCDPDSSLSVLLTAPTTGKKLSGKIKVEPHFGWSPGSEGSPEFYQQNPDEEYDSLYLRSPMQGAGKHLIQIQGLTDRFGRPLKGPNQISVTTTNFTPMLQLPEGYGVLEKKGPRQLGFSGVNAKEVDLEFYHSKSVADIKMWSSYNYCHKSDPEQKFIYQNKLKKHILKVEPQLNIPFTAPISLPQIAPDFQYGLFVGKMQTGRNLDGTPFDSHALCSNIFSVVTDLGIMAKTGFYNSGVWIHSLQTGLPIKNVKVGLHTDTEKIFEGLTDAQGFLELPGAQKWDPERSLYGSWGGQNLYVVAETKDDFSMLPFSVGRKGLDYYEFGEHYSPLKQSTNHIVQAITDRPLYKPGQKVNVKVFARHWEPRSYGLRPAKKIEIEVKDALDKSVLKKTIQMSDFGTAHFSFELDAGSPLGTFNFVARVDGFEEWVGQFDVQVFTLPAFKVQVEAQKKNFIVGESANFQTRARYHFGGGVPNTSGEYTALFTPGDWRPKTPAWESFTFDNAFSVNIAGYDRPRAPEIKEIAKSEIKTDKNGDLDVGILLPNDQIKSYGKIEYGVAFKDDRGKSIAGYGSAEVFNTQFQVGLKTPKWIYEAKEDLVPEVILLDQNERPVAGVNVDLKLIHRTYKTVRRHGEGSYFYFDTKTKDREIASCTFKSLTTAKGCVLKSKAAGDHYIVALAKDSRGRVTTSAIQKYVTGKEYIGWYRENHDRIDVIPDKKKYQVGETLKLLVKNPYTEVDAIITLERFGILKQIRRKLTKGAETLSIPLDSKDYAPGFYVAVHLTKGRVSEKLEGGVDLGRPSFKMGMARISVEDPDTVLSVTAQSDKIQYEPGDKSQVTLNVKSPAGQEVTELSVAVVDEKILQLSGDYEGRYQLHNKFYELRGGDVATSQMLSLLIGRRHFGKKGAPAGGDGDSQNKVRKNILPLAYWNPTVRTDKSGRAVVSFNLPDNLTTWRVLVVAVDKKHRFGFGSGTFRTAKKVMIEPSLPSFLTEGDRLNTRFTVFNRTGESAKIKAQIKTTGVELLAPSEKEQLVAHDGKSYFEWPVKTPYGQTQAQFQLSAMATKGRDAVSETLPIYPFASYETFANYGSTTESVVNESLLIPQDIRTEFGGLEVVLSPSLITHLDDSFRYLFQYPYSCWEQTLVRALALNQYIQLKAYLTIPELAREPKAWAAELIREMPKFQYENGAMAYWKPHQQTTDPYLSVFTALGLQWLRQTDLKAPQQSEIQLLSYVRRLTEGTEAFPLGYSARSKAVVMAMANYVLAQEGDNTVPLTNKLFQERQNLSLFGKSFLWMAAAKKPETKPLLAQLKNEIYSAADFTSGTLQFKEQNDDGFVQILHSTTRTNCSLLSAILSEDPQGPFVEPLVRWIIAGRKANRWNNTQENLYCQNALAQYAKIYEKETPQFSVSGRAMNQKLKGTSLKDFKDQPTREWLPFTADLVGQKSNLVLEKKGKGRLYYTARMKIAYKNVRTTAVNSGLQVNRTYFTKKPSGEWQKQEGVIKIKRGELVKVQLKVNIPAVRHHVVLEDRLPAGLEPVNTALATAMKQDAQAEENGRVGNDYWSEDADWYGFYSSGGFYHREMRLHAVQYFAQFMSAGEFNLAYVAQAVATGEFNANPALIEQMYEPEVYGKSTPAQFIIEE